MRIGIATDHNGVNEKKVLIDYLKSFGHEVVDYSPNNYDTDDYPAFAYKVSKSIINKEIDRGILLCGTGIGMSIAANKVKGIRCAKVSSVEEARLCSYHNNATVIALSYKTDIDNLKEMVITYINSNFACEERHVRRIDMINKIEEGTYEG